MFNPKTVQNPDSLFPWYVWSTLAFLFISFAAFMLYKFIDCLRKEDLDLIDYINITKNNKDLIQTFNENQFDNEEEKQVNPYKFKNDDDFEEVYDEIENNKE